MRFYPIELQRHLLLLTLFLIWGSPGSLWAEDLPEPRRSEAQAQIIRGANLYRTASCVGCHSFEAGGLPHLGGGRYAQTEYGAFYTPNISADPEVGIGNWNESDFLRAMKQGISPDGRRYWPGFPYQAYTYLSDTDLKAIWAYLQSEPPSDRVNQAHEIQFPYNLPGLVRFWRGLYFDAGPFEEDPSQSTAWNRGAYIAQAMLYCQECHTPRTKSGGLKGDFYLAGGINRGKDEVEVAPNITPDTETGLGDWQVDDFYAFFTTGEKPDGTRAHQTMAEKIDDSIRFLSDADRWALATYIQSVPAIMHEPPSE